MNMTANKAWTPKVPQSWDRPALKSFIASVLKMSWMPNMKLNWNSRPKMNWNSTLIVMTEVLRFLSEFLQLSYESYGCSPKPPPCPTWRTLHHDNLHGVLCAMTYAHTHPTSRPLHWTLHGQHHPVHPDITILISQSAVNNSRRHWSSMTDSSNDTVMGNTTQCMARTRMVFQSRGWASLCIWHRRRIWRWIGMRVWHMSYESRLKLHARH